MESTSLIAETAARLLRHYCDPQTLNRSAGDDWQGPAWAALEAAGLPLAWVPEDLGGAGASLEDGFGLLSLAGRYAVPLPLAETLLAGWLLARGKIAVPPGMHDLRANAARRETQAGEGRHLERPVACCPLCQGRQASRRARGT